MVRRSPVGLQILLIYTVLCSQKYFKLLNVKVVPNDTFEFGAEIVKHVAHVFEINTIKEIGTILCHTLSTSKLTEINKVFD